MGYYLSEKDKAYVMGWLEMLQNATRDVTLNTKTPHKLSGLLRNAFNVIPEFQLLKTKFKIITREDKVILRNRLIQFEVEIQSKILENPDIFEILDELIKIPELLRIENPNLNEKELNKLITYCNNNGYKFRVSDGRIECEKAKSLCG